MYNYFRQGWIVSRLVQTSRKVFGEEPLVVTLPSQEVVQPDGRADGFTLCLSGAGVGKVRAAFANNKSYRLPANAALSPASANGFAQGPMAPDKGSEADWLKFTTARVEQPAGRLRTASDAWP